jgi:ribosome-associated toxin RatA of RatAB toxin-antitoxin module
VGVPPFLQETYDSAVYIDHQQYTIETHSIKSQKFDSLKSYWKLSVPSITTSHDNFPTTARLGEHMSPNVQHPQSSTSAAAAANAMESTTNVYFMVEMTVSDPLIVTTLDQLLVKVAKQQVDAFAQRCQSV